MDPYSCRYAFTAGETNIGGAMRSKSLSYMPGLDAA